MDFTLSYERHHIHFHVIGEGEMPILFFHGIHQDGLAFQDLMERFPQCTFYCMDMPFHGKTDYKNDRWNVVDIQNIFELFLQKIQKEKVGIGGFSIGAKIALKVIELLPIHQFSALFLFAPDGISINRFYDFSTKNIFGQKLFTYFLSHPKQLFWLGNLFYKIKILPRHTFQVFKHSIQQSEQLYRIKKFWRATATIQPNLKKIQNKLHHNPIPVYIFIGKKDSLIPVKKIKSFYTHLAIPEKGLFELDINHNFTHSNAIQLIYQCIENNILIKCSSIFK